MMDLHKIASLLVRDYTIIAKRHYDMARDSRAIADTWRQVLADTVPVVLTEQSTREDGKLGAPASIPGQESWAFVDVSGKAIS
jgi:hypothetical protein